MAWVISSRSSPDGPVGRVLTETLAPFGKWSVYLQTGGLHATVLFHMIPAITDFLRRLPVGDPFVDSLDAPLVQSFHLAFLAAFIVGVLAQWMWLTAREADTMLLC